MTLSLVAVFIPVLFMGGIIGRLVHEFAVTISIAILVSCFVSLTLTPMLCGRFLRPSKTAHHGRVYAASERFFEGMLRAYDKSLKIVLKHRWTTLVVSNLIFAVTIYLFMTVPKGFLPTEDTGQLFGSQRQPRGSLSSL
jgi:HAE1 family hydrophobic/amphiphilic exporter-1